MKKIWEQGSLSRLIVIGIAICLLVIIEAFMMAHGG
jgi:hypothetical protein